MDQKDFYTGFEARGKQHLLTLSSPLEAGAVTNFEALERILLELVHNELKCTFQDRRILITEQPGHNTKEQREALAQLFFEKFAAEAIFFANQQVLSLYASSRTTGVVVDCGHARTNIVPVFEGFAIPFATVAVPIGGRALTEMLRDRLVKDADFVDSLQRDEMTDEIAQSVKENFCSVALDYELSYRQIQEGAVPKQRKYILPGTHREILVRSEDLIWPGESLFQPLDSADFHGLHKSIIEAVYKCDPDTRL